MPDTEHRAVLIIGSGPAGLFCADQLLAAGVCDVVMLEQGKSMPRRICPDSAICDCRPCDVLEGEGGAGSFSDGKITLSPTRGTHGARLFTPDQHAYLPQIEHTIRRFTGKVVDYPTVTGLPSLEDHAGAALSFDSYPLIHVGSDGIRSFGHRYSQHLGEAGVDVRMGQQVTSLLVEGGRARGAVVRDRRSRSEYRILAERVVVACGLAGTAWLEAELARAGVTLSTGPADFGIRLETTATALAPFITKFYDFKVSHHTAGLDLRSFCVNGGGYVVAEYHRGLGIRGVNGHSYLSNHSELSNLAIVATIAEEHQPDPKRYARQLAAKVNAAADGYPIRQPLGELLAEAGPPARVRPTNRKTRPGRLQDALPDDLLAAFLSYIHALGQVLPPVLAADTVLYAPEIKYYAYRVPINTATWESTDVTGLYVVGNAAGYTASLSAAALSGIIAANAITERHPKPATASR